ncbi:MAG TPA: winged helix-turn-helix domain-containing protein [Verrucomicrobiae bacterium]|nr:winged helix-turn-helix domain-containing protein [Verrucomicrobiae bacterium]
MSVRDYQFGQFHLTPELYELTRAGRPVRLEKIPFDLLVLLVEHRHELVSRDLITASLWGNGGFRDLDQSLNTAIRKVRQALRDSAEEPRFIQTVVGRGYRFLPDVDVRERPISPKPPEPLEPPAPPPPAVPKPGVSRLRGLALFAGVVVALFTAGWLAFRGPHDPALIAVLPFDDLNGDPAQAYLSRGLTEEVITQLGRVVPAGFGVIAGPSVWRYRASQLAPQKIASELGAGYILTGGVEHDASHVRASARLIRARDGLQLWADTFDGPSDAALPLQADIAASVARAIPGRLAPLPAPASRRRIDGEAADLYLRGRFYWNQRTEVSLKQAIEYLEQSIARAPAYAPAYAALADCYAAMVYSCYLAPTTGFAHARSALERAAQLDAQAPEVLASEGYLNMYFDWDLAKAARNLERAVAANPNYATAYDWLGVLYTASKRFTAAQNAFDRARRLDPASLPIRTDLAFQLHYSGRNEDARQELQNILRVDPNFPLAHFWMGRVLSSESNCPGALSELEAASSSSLRDWQPVIAAHGHISGMCGQASRALEDLRRFDDIARGRFVTSYGYALIYAGLREKEQALVWLRKAVEERSHWLVWIRVDPRFDALRGDPRFQQLVGTVFPAN